MTQENKNKELKFRADRFTVWNKESKQNEASKIVDSVFINEVTSKEGKKFLTIDVKTNDNVTHSSVLNSPVTQSQKQISALIRDMPEEKQKELLSKVKEYTKK